MQGTKYQGPGEKLQPKGETRCRGTYNNAGGKLPANAIS